MPLQLDTTDTELHGLQTAVDRARSSSSSVTVSKEALRHLLADHFTLYSAATGPVIAGRGKGHTVTAGADQASLL